MMTYSKIVKRLQQCNQMARSRQDGQSPQSLPELKVEHTSLQDLCRQTIRLVLQDILDIVESKDTKAIQDLVLDSDTVFPQAYQGYNHSGASAWIQTPGLMADCLRLYGLDSVGGFISSLYTALDDLHTDILSEEEYQLSKVKEGIENIRVLVAN